MIIKYKKQKIDGMDKLASVFYAILDKDNIVDKNKEHFWVAGVNVKLMIQYIELVSLGNINSSIVSPREVFRFAIMKGVYGIFICHNHPSGDVEPSEDDLIITQKLVKSGKIIDINIIDHLIIGKCFKYYSFKDKGLI